MIVSHRYKFIFLKTHKTAGSSIEYFLANRCGPTAIVTPISPPVDGHRPRNDRGHWNPLPELLANRGRLLRTTLRNFSEREQFYNHIPARQARWRLPQHIWNTYFKFCVERNPWDKTISHFFMRRFMYGERFTFDNYLKLKDFAVDHSIYTDVNRTLQVDRVIRFEHLNDQLEEVFKTLGLRFNGDLGVRTKSVYRKNRRPYQEIYSDRQREIVAQAFAWEIETFGYKF